MFPVLQGEKKCISGFRTILKEYSRLKIIKSERLRTGMHEDYLNMSSVMSIERDILDSLSFDNIVDDFAEEKNQEKYPICEIIYYKYNDC